VETEKEMVGSQTSREISSIAEKKVRFSVNTQPCGVIYLYFITIM
jgi:hypothetical protein